jgi:hypothetical protein
LAASKKYFDMPRRIQRLDNALRSNEIRKMNYAIQVLGEFGLSVSKEKPERDPHAFISSEELFALFENGERARRIVG